MLIFATCSTMSLICAMAIDRYMSICQPFLYERLVSIGKVKYVLLGVWIVAAVMGCMPIIGFGENTLQFPGTWCFFTFTSGVLKNKVFAFLFVFIGLLSIAGTVATNTFVIKDLIKIRRKTQREAICNACTYRHSVEIQMMVLMIGIMVIFTTCWCPFLIRIIVNQINERQVSKKTDLLALRLASLNQILDPWIYILFRKELFTRFRDVVRTFILYCGQNKASLDKTDNNNKITNQGRSSNSDFDSMKNNVDDNDMSSNNISSTSGRNLERRMSLREAWQSTHLRHEEKSTLRQLVTQHKPACFGLYHPASIYCFTSLPQNFALTLGINSDKDVCHTIQEVEQFLTESEPL
ncbi:Prostaglandin E2 receptor EP4 subtype [Mactra antiquata]